MGREICDVEMFARGAHAGQKHGDRPYTAHLQDVVKVLRRWTERFQSPSYYRHRLICGAWLHDAIEDTGVTYQDIRNLFGEDIASLVWLVTDEIGRNRSERKEKTLPKIFSTYDSTVLKLADTTANIERAFADGAKLCQMYEKEWPEIKNEFEKALQKWDPQLLPVLDELQQIMENADVRG